MRTITVDCRMLRASGIGTYLRAVLGRLIAAQRYRFNLIGKESELIEWLPKDIEDGSVINCDAPLYGAWEQWELWRSIPKDTDLFWAPHYVIPLFYKGKMIVTVHDVCHLAMKELLPGSLARLYARFMFNMVANRAGKIITVSDFTKNELIRFTKADGNNIKVIYNGCPEITESPVTNEGINSESYILYVGNIKPHKNMRRVIEAHSKCYSVIQKPLVIIGKKNGFITRDPALENLMRSIPKSQVFFTGYVSDLELAAYYRGAAMLVFASLYEGFGLPALEAMSYGIPVLASNVASLPEVCGDAALYCDPYSVDDIADKMALLLSDRNLRERLIKKGEERIKLFSWDNCGSEHLHIIEHEIE